MDIQLKRVYEPASPADGARYLVDRLWPRGISRSALALTAWLKNLAPSHELRRWFGHNPARWDEFRRRYWRELEQKTPALQELRRAAEKGRVTLLYAAADPVRNQAVVLREFLTSTVSASPGPQDFASAAAKPSTSPSHPRRQLSKTLSSLSRKEPDPGPARPTMPVRAHPRT